MKNQIPMPAIIAAVIVLLIGIVVYGYMTLNPSEPTRDGRPLGAAAAPAGGAPASGGDGVKRQRASGPLE